MRSRIIIALLVGLSVPVAASAEPARTPIRKADPAAEKAPAVLVTASSDVAADAKAKAEPGSEVVKPRRGRVTTCRCGDQQPNDD